MRKVALPAVPVAVLLVASVALAARGATPARHVSLERALASTSAARSLRFQLTVRIETAGAQPQTLRVRGATGGAARRVHLKVADVVAPDGTTMTGPSADEKVDGTFLYLRSSVTRPSFGPLWVREPLAKLAPDSPELAALRAVSPASFLRALARAGGVRPGAEAGVFHAWLPFDDPAVRSALAGVEGGLEYRRLRLTAWTGSNGYVRLLLLTGRTPDRSSHVVLTLSLHGYGAPVAVTPPPQGRFVDFDLSQLRT